MTKITALIILLVPFLVSAQQDSIASGAYSWKTPVHVNVEVILSAPLFGGSAHDMESLEMSARELKTSKRELLLLVPPLTEQLLIIKSGTITIGMQDSTWTIGTGSVVLLMPGQRCWLKKANDNEAATYYLMKYKSRLPTDPIRGQNAGGSFVKDWNNILFKPHDKGGIRNFFERATAMCKRFEMHVTTLNEGFKSHDPHTHRAEEIILVMEGKTEMQIGDAFYKGSAGTIYYLGSQVAHAIRNDGTGSCTYFAFQFE